MTEGVAPRPEAVAAAPSDGVAATASRIVAGLGIGFLVLFFVGFFISITPDLDKSDKIWHDWYADSGNRHLAMLSGVLIVLGLLCLLGFFAMLWTGLARGVRGSGRSVPLPLMASAAGCALIAVAATVITAIPAAVTTQSMPVPGADLLRATNAMAYPLLALAGMPFIALAIASLATTARRAGYFGQGLYVFSLLMAFILLFSIMFFPMAALVVWLLTMAVVLVRRPLAA